MICENCGKKFKGEGNICNDCFIEMDDAISNIASDLNIQQNISEVQAQDVNNQKHVKNKKVKKKKHTFLKIILVIILIILAYNLLKLLCNKIAKDRMQSFVDSYPFEFENENDSIFYITGDFDVPVEYTNETKKYNVEWNSSSEILTIDESGHVTVTRSDKGNKNVTLTQEYKFLIGKATLDYDCTVITSCTQSVPDIEVVDKNSIINNTYTEKMELQLNDDGSVRYMYGDFGSVHIYTEGDAVTVAEAYKFNLGIDSIISFKFSNLNTTESFMIYTLDAYYNGIKLTDNVLQLTVEKSSFKLIKITNNITIDLSSISQINTNLDYEQILKDYINDSSQEYIFIESETVIYENQTCKKYIVYFKNGAIYTAYISNVSGKVIAYVSDLKDTSLFRKWEVDCNGEDETGKNLSFNAAYSEKESSYILYDLTRNIHAYDNEGYWNLINKAVEEMSDDDWYDIFIAIGGLADLYISANVNFEIKSDTTTFDNSVAVQAYKNIQDAYDWYAEVFNRYSYDNKGSEIKVLTDCDMQTDNACWSTLLKVFQINPAERFKYSVGKDLEVLGHEYTHAVFSSYTSGEGAELSGINEGYADVFGCLISGTDTWKIGSNVYTDSGEELVIRDLKDYNGDDVYIQYSEKYHDDTWKSYNGEEHVICVLIGHVGYEMYASDLFSSEDVARIWYESLAMGYNGSSTFVDARKQLIQATEQLGYGKECMDFIAYQFDLEEIYDPSYEITTDKYLDNEIVDEEESNVYKTEGKAISGDIIFDDSTSRTFVIFVSPLGTIFGNMPIYIFEESTGATEEEIEYAQKYLTAQFNKALNEDNNTDFEWNVTVEYKQYPKWAMNILEKLLSDSESDLNSKIYEGLGYAENEDEFNIGGILLNISFVWDSVNMTPYQFYKTIGLI